jgi:hypothetical protein
MHSELRLARPRVNKESPVRTVTPRVLRRELRLRYPRQKPKEMQLLSRYDLRQMIWKEDYVYRLAMTKSTWRYRTLVRMTIRSHTLC